MYCIKKENVTRRCKRHGDARGWERGGEATSGRYTFWHARWGNLDGIIVSFISSGGASVGSGRALRWRIRVARLHEHRCSARRKARGVEIREIARPLYSFPPLSPLLLLFLVIFVVLRALDRYCALGFASLAGLFTLAVSSPSLPDEWADRGPLAVLRQ